MKRLLTVITTILVAALFLLPAAAIINLDGTEPEWDGDPGIRPAMETIDGEADAVLFIGDPTDELPGDGDAEDDVIAFDRSHLARGAQAEPAALSGVTLALYIGLGAVSLAALALSTVAIVKVRKK